MKIKTKKEFYKLYKNELLGNKLRSFDNINELFNSDYAGNVSIRYKDKNREDFKKYHIPVYDALQFCISKSLYSNTDINKFYFNESPPDHKLLIQGEVFRFDDGLNLLYSFEKIPLSTAMNYANQALRSQALYILKYYMDPNSYNDLEILLDTYDNAVIEFGVYSCDVGIIKNRNTIFWEVRNY